MFYELVHPLDADYYTVSSGDELNFPSHLHECFEVVIIASGEMRITIDGVIYTVRAGRATMIFPNRLHSFATSAPCSFVLCVFSGRLVNSFARKTRGRLPCDPVFSCPIEWAKRLSSLKEKPSIITVKGVLYSLCGLLDEGAVYKEIVDSAEDGLLYKIFAFIEERYADDCTLGSLSEKTAYSYVYLSRFFKSAVGVSYNEYVARYRISAACHMLKSTDKSIIEIALACGFNSQRSFDRRFRAVTGFSPRDYRNFAENK